MTQRHYTLTETLSVVEDLDAEQLQRYIRAGVVVPVQSSTGPLFRELDLARLSLVVDLSEGYHLDEEALAGWAAEHGTALRLLVRRGDYLFPGAPIALMTVGVAGAEAAIRSNSALGASRGSNGDAEQTVRQLVEVATGGAPQ